MDSEKPIWCPKCFVRIAPYDLRTFYQKVAYHQACFLKLVREQADEETRRAIASRAGTARNQYVRTR